MLIPIHNTNVYSMFVNTDSEYKQNVKMARTTIS